MTVILAHSPVSLSVAVCKDFVSLDYNLHVSFHDVSSMYFISCPITLAAVFENDLC